MQKVNVELKDRSYPVYVQRGILGHVSDVLTELIPVSSRIALFSSKTVESLYRKDVKDSLEAAGYKVDTISMPSGEQNKNLDTVQSFYETLLDLRYDRGCTIIAMGGGVVGDTAGFVAATLFRGINLVQIPTTLLAQVDSSIGGKVGVNHAMGKNLIGSIYQPKVVIVDPDVLKTLEKRERVSGFGEVIKYGFIKEKAFADYLLKSMDDLLNLKNMDDVTYVIHRSIEIKAAVVANDEQESGLRMILNFGHTIGHAIELTEGYGKFKHGEGVILGMCAALKLSREICGFNQEDYEKYLAAFLRIPIYFPIDKLNTDSILKAIALDKKVREGKTNFVLLNNVGECCVRNDVDPELIKMTVEWLKEQIFAQG